MSPCSGGWGGREGSQPCTQWGDAHCQMSLVWDGRGDEDLWHVGSVGHFVTHVPSGDGGGEEDLWHVRSRGRSVTHVSSGG